jgi:hypothetical protein
MLKLREEQLASFSLAMRQAFVNRLMTHVGDCFPQQARALGPEQTRMVLEKTMARADALELQSEHDLCELVNLVFVLGDRFEDDPRLVRVTAVLHDLTITPTARMREVRRLTLAFLQGREP